MLCTIKLKQQIVASDRLHKLKISRTCQNGRDIILTENKFLQTYCYTLHQQLTFYYPTYLP